MIILVTGDRNWDDISRIKRMFEKLKSIPVSHTIIHGGARGADTLSGAIAQREFSFDVIEVPAHWNHVPGRCPENCKELQGPAAGPIRNRKMLNMNPDRVFAFHKHIEESKGTKDMIRISLKAGKDVYLDNGISCEKYSGLKGLTKFEELIKFKR